MTETLLQRFQRAMAVPQEDASVKLARALGAFNQPPQSPPVTVNAPAYMAPYQGPHNEPYAPTVPTPTATVLPPFEQPGGSLPIQPYMQSAQPQAPAQAPVPAMAPPMPPPQPVAPQQQQPSPQALALAQALQPQRQLLPEQWRGSFGNQYGEPT